VISGKDIGIITRLQKEEIKALEDIYNALHVRLYVFLFRIVNNQEIAEDIVQSTFVKVWENREKLSVEKPLDAQVYVIARNLLLNQIRRTKTEQRVFEQLAYRENTVRDAIHEVSYRETLNLYEQAINRLPPKRRQIYRLSYLQGLSIKEIAELLSISCNTVENHLAKANRFIRENLHYLKEFIVFLIFAESV
jgi:RNA polymerase sigma-70 factor (ECF subfamily)